ncbi:hypothetical protein M408DRAFT_23124 [Serendipita vermifera MAFF 305830]|uniref:DUF6532 domain-containing protein n=1 Tax=Serendipita vermifera MAFF 305830 TaxID=933852 RepID=A0A0C3AXU2_SERVB|nr:hypothetical protein M408DRAFT_23124 [Serendipita vermifera MAFF 305830]
MQRNAWEGAVKHYSSLFKKSTVQSCNEDIQTMLRQAGDQARSSMHKHAKSVVFESFKLLPPELNARSKAGQDAIATNAKFWRAEFRYLCGPYRTSNGNIREDIKFTHPAIQQVIQRALFMSRPTGLAHRLLTPMVPYQAIALASAAIRCVLDSWVTGVKKKTEFGGKVYQELYIDLRAEWLSMSRSNTTARAKIIRGNIADYGLSKCGASGRGIDVEESPSSRI